ncbi:hypothetical protein SAMN02799624_02411 [Paenibacillus sp. UNC496MF]|uniref:hypothetical protein n=1 Tax=Paenibacillus sp. UNC496MF TaxID=1502753 RepID=UPI0008F0E4DC|nr:hypothetical protein [Paenibacillus sp. UNC496MF]SFI86536.1 hypothetical protein SAMN02799624_02411 [Paenibacillus sp. UNC496MF]
MRQMAFAPRVHSHGYAAETTRAAKDEFFPRYAAYMNRFLAMRGRGGVDRQDFERMAGPETALAVGSPQQIFEKMLHQRELFGHDRHIVQLDIGGMPFARVAKAIELLAADVAPAVRRAAAAK